MRGGGEGGKVEEVSGCEELSVGRPADRKHRFEMSYLSIDSTLELVGRLHGRFKDSHPLPEDKGQRLETAPFEQSKREKLVARGQSSTEVDNLPFEGSDAQRADAISSKVEPPLG